MARLPNAALDTPDVQPLVPCTVAERGSVLRLCRIPQHSPPLAEGWLGMMTAVRRRLALPGDLREGAILRIAQLNHAPYEADQHQRWRCAKGSRILEALPIHSDDRPSQGTSQP